jgi:hypothetical protein
MLSVIYAECQKYVFKLRIISVVMKSVMAPVKHMYLHLGEKKIKKTFFSHFRKTFLHLFGEKILGRHLAEKNLGGAKIKNWYFLRILANACNCKITLEIANATARGSHNIHHDEIQNNDTQHNGNQNNDIQHINK